MKFTPTNNSNLDFKLRVEKWSYQIFSSLKARSNALCYFLLKNCQDNNKHSQYILSYGEPDLCNYYILKEQDRKDRFSVNFLGHCVLGHVLSDTDPLNDVDLWKKVIRPTKKPRSVDPLKSKPIQTAKKTMNNKKTRKKNRKSRSFTVQVPDDHRDKNKEPRSDNTQGTKKPWS